MQQLPTTLLPHLTVTNEPARIACGAPDFILTRQTDTQPAAFPEAKDIGGTDLDNRHLHLMEDADNWLVTAIYPVSGSDIVTELRYVNEKVYINPTPDFGHVTPEIRNAHTGGYQPDRKWLKDRKNRHLGFEDIRHYQQILYVLGQTRQIMAEIDRLTT